MKRLLILAAVSASLMASACVTVIDATDSDNLAWHGEDAQPFDDARAACRASTGKGVHSDAFRDCMAGKGWTRS
jgi:protein involved in sex pheromone biosynthesis